MVQLGEGFRSPAPTPDAFVASIVSEVTRQVTQALTAQLAQMDRRINALAGARPSVQVAAPNVAAPQVHVAPQINMPDIVMPDMPDMNCTVTIPGLEDVARYLGELVALEKLPVTRSVSRDRQGLLASVTEKRG